MRYAAWIAVALWGVVAVRGDDFSDITNSIESLTFKQATEVAQYEGNLSLGGLTMLSAEAAEALRANPKIGLPDKFKR
jgi:hypothetical protein